MSRPTRPPLKLPWLHILVALAEEELHGSGIVRSVLEHTGGELRLWPATLYGSLDAMSDEGLIRELRGDEHPDGVSAKRRYYAIEPRGREVLREEGERLSWLAGLALQSAKGG